jgi:hypothetical protein
MTVKVKKVRADGKPVVRNIRLLHLLAREL